MNKTGIEYLTHTWNPIAMRCTPVSEGCKHCWHISMATRLASNPLIPPPKQNAYFGGQVYLDIDELQAPLKCRKPAFIGVQFMGDFFHEAITRDMREAVYRVIEKCPQHNFLLLTKRPENICSWWIQSAVNVWIGVTVENQAMADERIPALLNITAAMRFVSVEPMLGPVDLSRYFGIVHADDMDGLDYGEFGPWRDGLNWIICGGETGPGARPMHPEWARSLRDQCVGARRAVLLQAMG